MLPTNLHDYHLEIRCPRCAGRARWEEPFALLYGDQAGDEERARLKRWGPWLIREKFPSVVRWTPPPRGCGYHHRSLGVSRCFRCHAVAAHRLRWPEDAYFQWDARGIVLYAWHPEHARVLLDYLGARLRDPTRYGEPYRKGLQRLPAQVLDGHMGQRLVRRIAGTLRAHGIPLHPPRPLP